MGAMASQITSLTIVYSTVYSGADQRKHQSSASLAFVRGIHRWLVNSPHKCPVTRKCFHLMTASCGSDSTWLHNEAEAQRPPLCTQHFRLILRLKFDSIFVPKGSIKNNFKKVAGHHLNQCCFDLLPHISVARHRRVHLTSWIFMRNLHYISFRHTKMSQFF